MILDRAINTTQAPYIITHCLHYHLYRDKSRVLPVLTLSAQLLPCPWTASWPGSVRLEWIIQAGNRSQVTCGTQTLGRGLQHCGFLLLLVAGAVINTAGLRGEDFHDAPGDNALSFVHSTKTWAVFSLALTEQLWEATGLKLVFFI